MKNEYCYRIIEQKDIEWARVLHNDPDVLYNLTDTTIINQRQQAAWFEHICNTSKSMRLVLELNTEPIGLARIDEIDYRNRSICVGLDIESKYRGQGHGKEGFKLMLDYVFKELNMNRAWLLVAEYNIIAHNLYKKMGFTEEGRLRERLFRNGKYHDYIMMSLLSKEYI